MAEPSVTGVADTPEVAEAFKAFAEGVSPNVEPIQEDAPVVVEETPAPETETVDPAPTIDPPVDNSDNQTPPPVPEP